MKTYLNTILLFVIAIGLWHIALHLHLAPQATQAQATTQSNLKDNEELAQLYKEDQADRSPKDGKSIDWKVVAPRDKAREARVKELYKTDQLKTGADYYHVAMVLQHADAPEDSLLAHELCVVAISKGEKRGKWLAAASEDRFLMRIGRPQRFATQYRSDGLNSPMLLYKVDELVTDGLRHELEVPSLAQAKEREAKMNEKKN